VPVDKLTPMYRNIQTHADMPALLLDQIAHFFEHYKDLEPGKFVKVNGWRGPEEAKKEIEVGVQTYNEAKDKPAY
jgi:inorganic pyrophosphatase